jgi:hypothetical protein
MCNPRGCIPFLKPLAAVVAQKASALHVTVADYLVQHVDVTPSPGETEPLLPRTDQSRRPDCGCLPAPITDLVNAGINSCGKMLDGLFVVAPDAPSEVVFEQPQDNTPPAPVQDDSTNKPVLHDEAKAQVGPIKPEQPSKEATSKVDPIKDGSPAVAQTVKAEVPAKGASIEATQPIATQETPANETAPAVETEMPVKEAGPVVEKKASCKQAIPVVKKEVPVKVAIPVVKKDIAVKEATPLLKQSTPVKKATPPTRQKVPVKGAAHPLLTPPPTPMTKVIPPAPHDTSIKEVNPPVEQGATAKAITSPVAQDKSVVKSTVKDTSTKVITPVIEQDGLVDELTLGLEKLKVTKNVPRISKRAATSVEKQAAVDDQATKITDETKVVLVAQKDAPIANELPSVSPEKVSASEPSASINDVLVEQASSTVQKADELKEVSFVKETVIATPSPPVKESLDSASLSQPVAGVISEPSVQKPLPVPGISTESVGSVKVIPVEEALLVKATPTVVSPEKVIHTQHIMEGTSEITDMDENRRHLLARRRKRDKVTQPRLPKNRVAKPAHRIGVSPEVKNFDGTPPELPGSGGQVPSNDIDVDMVESTDNAGPSQEMTGTNDTQDEDDIAMPDQADQFLQGDQRNFEAQSINSQPVDENIDMGLGVHPGYLETLDDFGNATMADAPHASNTDVSQRTAQFNDHFSRTNDRLTTLLGNDFNGTQQLPIESVMQTAPTSTVTLANQQPEAMGIGEQTTNITTAPTVPSEQTTNLATAPTVPSLGIVPQPETAQMDVDEKAGSTMVPSTDDSGGVPPQPASPFAALKGSQITGLQVASQGLPATTPPTHDPFQMAGLEIAAPATVPALPTPEPTPEPEVPDTQKSTKVVETKTQAVNNAPPRKVVSNLSNILAGIPKTDATTLSNLARVYETGQPQPQPLSGTTGGESSMEGIQSQTPTAKAATVPDPYNDLKRAAANIKCEIRTVQQFLDFDIHNRADKLSMERCLDELLKEARILSQIRDYKRNLAAQSESKMEGQIPGPDPNFFERSEIDRLLNQNNLWYVEGSPTQGLYDIPNGPEEAHAAAVNLLRKRFGSPQNPEQWEHKALGFLRWSIKHRDRKTWERFVYDAQSEYLYCKVCQVYFPPLATEFDHKRNIEDKRRLISSITFSSY